MRGNGQQRIHPQRNRFQQFIAEALIQADITSLSATLTAHVPITIIQQPPSMMAVLGTNLTFIVVATSTEPSRNPEP
jgi:hypothetical protein